MRVKTQFAKISIADRGSHSQSETKSPRPYVRMARAISIPIP